MDIVACVDRNFVMPTGVMVYSVCCNNQDVDIFFHLIIDESVTEKDKDDLEKTISCFQNKRVEFYAINSKKVVQFPNVTYCGPTLATYYRLFLTELLPETIDKVLYLDGDVIVRKSLLSLWNTNISHVALAAAPDCGAEKMEPYTRLQYAPCLGYFNAGVLLLNMRYWRENNVFNIFYEYIKSYHDNIIFHDQDVLNYVFRESKLTLPIEYNLMQDYLSRENMRKYNKVILNAIKDPVIVHFSGTSKPWGSYIRDPHPFSDLFYKYQSQTTWNGCRYEIRPMKIIMKNFVSDNLRRLKILSPLEPYYVNIKQIDKQ